jgi:hypothetical protein
VQKSCDPEVVAKVMAGELSPNAALVQAGIRKKPTPTETYKAAIEATGMSYSTVTKIASICSAYETCRRRQNLSFNHHVEVWSLPPAQQDKLLDRAEVERLSRQPFLVFLGVLRWPDIENRPVFWGCFEARAD